MNKKFSLFFALFSVCVLTIPPVTSAMDQPNFPSCTNPSGTLQAHYDSGTHAIAGDTTLHSGADTVYTSNSNAIQCFCPDSSETTGIQTNWWNAQSMSTEQVNDLKSQGWVYILNGSDWGLESGAYLAINSNYSCKSAISPTPSCSVTPTVPLSEEVSQAPIVTPTPTILESTNGISETLTPTPSQAPTPTQAPTNSQSPSVSTPTQTVAGIALFNSTNTTSQSTPPVSGLANTGGSDLPYLLFGSATFSALTGFFLKRKKYN